MNVTGLVWLGTRTERFDETAEFFGRVLRLRALHQEPGFAVFETENGDKVEVFGPQDREHGHFATGPVVGFGVDDVEGAKAEMEAAGVQFIGPVRRWEDGSSSAHFRGPDGNVYEITGVPPSPTDGRGDARRRSGERR